MIHDDIDGMNHPHRINRWWTPDLVCQTVCFPCHVKLGGVLEMTVSQFNTPSKTIRRSEQYHKKNTKLYDLWWSWCHGSWQPTFPLRQGPGEKEIALLLCQGRPGSNRVWDMRPTLDVVWERVPCPKRVPLFLRTWVTWSKNQKHITAQYILAVVMFRWPIQIWVLFPSARLWCLGWW